MKDKRYNRFCLTQNVPRERHRNIDRGKNVPDKRNNSRRARFSKIRVSPPLDISWESMILSYLVELITGVIAGLLVYLMLNTI